MLLLVLIPRPSWAAASASTSESHSTAKPAWCISAANVLMICVCVCVCVRVYQLCRPGLDGDWAAQAGRVDNQVGARVGVEAFSQVQVRQVVQAEHHRPSKTDHPTSTHPKPPRLCQERRREGEPGNLGYAHQPALALASRTNGLTCHLLSSFSPQSLSSPLISCSGPPPDSAHHPVTLPGLPLAHARQCHLHHSPPHDFGVINPPLLPAVSQKPTSPRFRGHGRAEMGEGPHAHPEPPEQLDCVRATT